MNRNYKKYLLMILAWAIKIAAQQNILLNQSAYNPYILNPAAIGLNNEITANCHYKKNWFGMSESPELVQLTVDGPFSKNKYGAGLNVINERAGIFSKTYLSGSLRFRAKLNLKHHLLFGLSAGFQRQLSDFSKIKADAPEEFQQWPQQQAVTIPDAAFGITYSCKKWLLGFSVTQLLQQNYLYREPVYNKELQY
ncbi:MAG: PorP/SprF family type IX secretion system membrane protein, partial [Bacteroidia bacterium]|nr:PorP/SprF family type IX secretion system membrane protein [Bacteroidia bacterium]